MVRPPVDHNLKIRSLVITDTRLITQRRQKKLFAMQQSDTLCGKLLDNDYVSFWKKWKSVSQAKYPNVNRIDDAIDKPDIANTFKNHFQQIYGDNESPAHAKL